MAWFEKNEKSGGYYFGFRLASQGNRKYKRACKLKDIRTDAQADAWCDHIEDSLRKIEAGIVEVPDSCDFAVFVINGGREVVRVEPPPRPKACTLGGLFNAYQSARSSDVDRRSTHQTEVIHMAHLAEPGLLGGSRKVDSIVFRDIQGYVDNRARQEGRRGQRIQRVTIEKELATLGQVWRWGLLNGLVRAAVPWRLRDLRMPLGQEKEMYRTYDTIRTKLDRGGVDASLEEALWISLYLTEQEVVDVLREVAGRATEPFILPMFTMVAYTGARRSEIVRVLIDDFDFAAGTVNIRGTKGRGRNRAVSRQVQLHPRLRDTMTEWFARHPGGQYALCHTDGSPLTKDAATHHFKATLRDTKWSVIKGFHVFRHSLCSNLASKSVDQRIIDSFVGHQTDEMRERYRHLHSKTQKEAIESIS